MIILLKRPLTLGLLAVLLVLAGAVAGRFADRAVATLGRLAANRRVPIYKVETAERKIALSFDATWGTELTDEILAILAEHGVRTTFFLAGYWVEKHPDYVRKIHEAGHEIGSHSYAHPHMNSLTKEQILADLRKNHELLKAITGQDATLFRPPFGEYSNKVLEAADSMGYHTVQWSIDSLDWKDVSADFMVRRVLSSLQPGEIVLFHNAGKHTPEAIRILIPEILARGYRIVPVGELIYTEDYVVDPNTGVQRRRGGLPTAPAAAGVPEGAVFEVPGAEGRASFAVNVDWGEEHIPAMLETFARTGVRVTFFVTGRWAERNASLLVAMADAGHEIATHGYSHAHPKQLTQHELGEHIVQGHDVLNRLSGGRAVRLYAPPYGEWDERIVARARELGFRTVLWSLDTVDWQDPPPQAIVSRIAPRLEAGKIVLMHPRRNTLEALPQLIEAAHAKGLRLVPVGELLGAEAGV